MTDVMNFPEREQEILKQWQERDIFKKTIEKYAPKGPFVFFEGPPTANGKPGIHHAESRAFKDCIPRFRTMQGYRVVRKAGWDTHGLPVELEVERQLGFTSKAQIEEYGIAAFNEKCRQSVWTYKKEWEEFTRRLGFWLDIEDAYVTYAPEYIESLWWAIKQIWDRGLLYKDYRVTPHCPRCGTSLSSHELSLGYKDVKDLSVTVKFRVIGTENEYLLAWTTTPWTLPGNVALAVGKDIVYVKVKQWAVDSGQEEFFWLAKDRLEEVKDEYEIVEEVKGDALIGKKYEPLFPYFASVIASDHEPVDVKRSNPSVFTVVLANFVTTAEGTGVVHTAVMYGQDDFELGQQIGLPKHHLVKLDGTFIDGMDFLSGRLVTDEEVAVDIIKNLAHRGLLFAKAKYEHSYPHCWRCKTKVIYYAKDSWYIAMSRLRDELLKQNEQIHWEPEHIKNGRFGEWIMKVKDWAFSRERYWGTPLPIWECGSCDHKMCIGSFEELHFLSLRASTALCLTGRNEANLAEIASARQYETRNDSDGFDPHRPYVDEIILKCEKCGGEAKRVPDVCDVWFDSGAMPFAQWHYPFENKELIDSGQGYPADYISEAIDQTRGWFYTLLAVSTLLGRERPFKNVICLGHVLDAEGKKMSKSLGNVVRPMEMIDAYGADAVRWYMYTINQPGESKRFDEKTLAEMVRKNFGLLWNVVEFYKMFASEHSKFQIPNSKHILDRWILTRLHQLIHQTTERLENYIVTETVRELGRFIDDLSTWYVRRSRDRFKGINEEDKQAAISTLQECLLILSKLMAPFAPFLADAMYQETGGDLESVHMESWPMADHALIDEKLFQDMEQTRAVVSRALERRAEAGINVRQVLPSLTLTIPLGELGFEYLELIKDEVNVKEIFLQKGEVSVALDLTLTPELLREGLIRELVRRVNAMRKHANLTLNDRIELFVSGDEEVLRALEEHIQTLLRGTLAYDLKTDGELPQNQDRFQLGSFDVTIGFVVK
jgi:isoleucyl-tRNA synthetase